jgi:CelD/BcsL family acetyltransferase involved in cellulose biosynthesis
LRPNTMYKATILDRRGAEIHAAIPPIAEEWEDLAERTRASPFRRPGWIDAWWRAFGKGDLEILTIRDDGRLLAVLPLGRRRGVLASTTNWHTPDFGPVAEDAAAARALTAALMARAPRLLSLAFVDVAEPILAECSAAAAAREYRVLTRTLERSPFVRIDRNWQSYEGELSRKVRGDTRRQIRRLKETGSMSVELHDGSERLDELLVEGFQVEAAGWKGARGTAMASQRETEDFYREIALWAATRGWLRLAFLRLDGRAIAFQYAVEHDGVHYYIKGGFDPSYHSFSPGKVLTYETLAHAFAAKLRSYEFLGADDPWKLFWTNSCRERKLFQAFDRSLSGSAAWALFRYGRPFAVRLAHHWPLTLLRR